MKKHIFKIFLVIAICLIFKIDSFALESSSFYREESATSYGFCKIDTQVRFNQIVDLQNINVKFTQNDTAYIFHVTGNAAINVYRDYGGAFMGSYAPAPVPLLYKEKNFGNKITIFESDKTPFADYKSGNIYSNSSIQILGKSIAYFELGYTLRSDGTIVNRVRNSWSNGDKYFVPNSLRDRTSARSYSYSRVTSFPYSCENNGVGVGLLSNNSYSQYVLNDVNINRTKCIDTMTININSKFSIKKEYIDDYKYVCFAQSYAFLTSQSLADLQESATGISICTQTIDLKAYTDCEHEWELVQDDKLNHKRHCEKCDWVKSESHELLYEYDGIKNNLCTCSYIDKVNYSFKIHDDNINELTALLDSNSPYTKYEFTSKKGYKFKYYKKYEKRLESLDNLSTVSNAISTKFISTCSELDDETGMCSVIYEAQYDVNQFTFIYSKINNKNLELDSEIEPQTIHYDEKAYLKKHTKLTGYAFKGWSLISGREEVDFEPMQEITNYTGVDLSEITVYPVYKNLDFKISYSSGKGTFSDGSRQKEVDYTYFDNSELEPLYINNSEDYLKCYTDQNGNMFYTMADVKKYIDDNELDNFTLKLVPVITRNANASSERNNDRKVNDEIRQRASTNSGPGVIENDLDVKVDNIIETYAYLDNRSIYGMSVTTKGEGDEESETMSEAKVATISFIRKPEVNDKDFYYKLRLLLLFIREHLLLASVCASLLIILIIIYEILIIRQYKSRV